MCPAATTVRYFEAAHPVQWPFSTSHQMVPFASLSHCPVAAKPVPFGNVSSIASDGLGPVRMFRPLSGSSAVIPDTITGVNGTGEGGASAAVHDVDANALLGLLFVCELLLDPELLFVCELLLEPELLFACELLFVCELLLDPELLLGELAEFWLGACGVGGSTVGTVTDSATVLDEVMAGVVVLACAPQALMPRASAAGSAKRRARRTIDVVLIRHTFQLVGR